MQVTEDQKNYFESSTYVNITDIMKKCGIKHYQKFNRLAERFDLVSDDLFTEIGKGKGRKYEVYQASAFVDKVKSLGNEESSSERITISEVSNILHTFKESVSKKFQKLSERFFTVDQSIASMTQKIFQLEKLESRVQTQSEVIEHHEQLSKIRNEQLEVLVMDLQRAVHQLEEDVQHHTKIINRQSREIENLKKLELHLKGTTQPKSEMRYGMGKHSDALNVKS